VLQHNSQGRREILAGRGSPAAHPFAQLAHWAAKDASPGMCQCQRPGIDRLDQAGRRHLLGAEPATASSQIPSREGLLALPARAAAAQIENCSNGS